MFEWTCPFCGTLNERSSIVDRKICKHCGREDHRELPDEDSDKPTRGYY